MTLRAAVALAVCALALLVLPWIIGNEFYVNMATQVLIYALFALSINMMLGYGGMVSLGQAGYLGIAGYACILAVTAGYDHLTAAVFAVVVSTAAAAFFGVLSLRDLIVAKPDTAIRDIMIDEPAAVGVMDHQREVANLVARYNLLAVPVVDDQGKLEGIVTVDDTLDSLLPVGWKSHLPRRFPGSHR
jgi:CBS domain-containing protein